jgi:hypothetical protein
MKKNYFISASIVTLILLFSFQNTKAQCYRKGSLLISITEGSTFANYKTTDISESKPKLVHESFMMGDRDPLILEYAVSNRWGIGFSSGADIFRVNSNSFYGFSSGDDALKVTTSEFTFDVNYHVYVNKKLDLSMFTSVGAFSVGFNGNNSDMSYNHSSSGTIVRYGTRARYYFYKRLGAIGMISSYAANSSPKNVKGNTEAKNYSTSINGMAIEMGLCFRILR